MARSDDLIALLSGIAIMGVEMAASRLLAPWFGTSTMVWAALIATVLGSLAVGAWFGGWAAARGHERRALARLLVAAGLIVGVLPWLAGPLLSGSLSMFASGNTLGLVGALGAMLLTVGLPVALVGAVSPMLIHAAASRGEPVGRAAGRLGALGTCGSLIGTIGGGVVLVPLAGASAAMGVFAGLLITAAAIAGLGARTRGGTICLVIAAVALGGVSYAAPAATPANGRLVATVDSAFQHIRVVETDEWRKLIVDEGFAVQSVRRLDGRLPLTSVWSWYALAPAWTDNGCPRRALLIGLGGGTSADILTRLCPGVRITGVELDEHIAILGRTHMGLPADVEVVIGDGRSFLRADTKQYDLIIVDAFRFPYLPFQLVTREAFEATARRLAPGGVVVVNVGRPHRGDRLLPAIIRTASAVFDHVTLVPNATPLNALVVARRTGLRHATGLASLGYPKEVQRRLARLGTPQPTNIEPTAWLLTDDRAPVAWLTNWAIAARLLASR